MNLFQPGCPWFEYHLNFPPNIEWCEEKLCSFIVTPFNAWTNMAYVLVGIYVWLKMRKSKSEAFRFFGPATVIVGLTSFLWHSSLNFYTQIFDFFGMYTFCVLLIMFNKARLHSWPTPPRAFHRFWIWVTGLTVLTASSLMLNPHFPIQVFVLLLILAILRTELMERLEKGEHRRWFWASFFTLLSAAVFSALDASRIVCYADNHWFQGHGVWHLLSALSLYFSYKHQAQFEAKIF